MKVYCVRVKNKDGELLTYEVPEEVYVYITQMEAYIRYPKTSKFLEANEESFYWPLYRKQHPIKFFFRCLKELKYSNFKTLNIHEMFIIDPLANIDRSKFKTRPFN